VQSGVCGPARMSYYTGRYVSSHGATWNRVPLSVAEYTLGDYMRAAGRSAMLAGKSHVTPDLDAIERFGVDLESERGALLREGGFTVVDRYDGHTPPGRESGYADFLRARGYKGDDPWSEYVIGVEAGGRFASGWQMRNVHLPARVAEPHSETAYMTDVALAWIRAQGDTPWVLHLSYVKPHWPYVAPAPFHSMFRSADVGPVLHGEQDGSADEHPVVHAYREHDECLSFGDEAVARHVRPAYMGLVAQVDAHLGRVLDALTAMGRLADTLIVFTSDHGEFMGDRGLGEKELFYDEIVRVPFIVCDPDPRADATRGRVEGRFVEAIDVVPTVLDALAIAPSRHRIEGRSLLPLTRALLPAREPAAWRDCVYSELDYGYRRARKVLRRGVRECRGVMARTDAWKYVHWEGFRPQLFDLGADPQELVDLGADARCGAERATMRERLFDWMATRKRRPTVGDEEVASHTDNHRERGIHIGIW
jgi:arylsulfatase A-like enzyme